MGTQYSCQIENNDFPRPISMGFLRHIPATPTNTHRVGKVYILVHKTRHQQGSQIDLTYVEEKRAHHSLLIDVAGASNDTELCGVWFHLTADVKTRETEFYAFGQPINRSSLVRLSKPNPDRLRPPAGVSNPREWALSLKREAERLYYMITENESIKWSGSVNCQQYVRHLVESLGLGIPTDLQLAGDTLPIIIDVAILLIAKKATKDEQNGTAAVTAANLTLTIN